MHFFCVQFSGLKIMVAYKKWHILDMILRCAKLCLCLCKSISWDAQRKHLLCPCPAEMSSHILWSGWSLEVRFRSCARVQLGGSRTVRRRLATAWRQQPLPGASQPRTSSQSSKLAKFPPPQWVSDSSLGNHHLIVVIIALKVCPLQSLQYPLTNS